jgi:hypothetical protein
MLKEERVPCQQCMAGLHRVCSHPVKLPTLLTYVRGRKSTAPETLMCCDRREFWTKQVYE